MKFGFFMMPDHHPSENRTLAYERDLESIELTERLGYDEMWIGEHHTAGFETIPAPDIMIAMAAARTKRIKFGTGVVNLPYHQPFHIAERMAFLDHLTRGRVMLGVGPGVLRTDMRLFGCNPEEMRPRMNESLDIIMKLFKEDGPITYEGQFYQVKDVELQIKCYQQPHLPVACAVGRSGNSLEQAAKHGQMILSGGFLSPATPQDFLAHWQRYEQRAKAAGHAPKRDDWRIAKYVYVAESDERAVKDIEQGAMREMREYFYYIGNKSNYEAYPGQPREEWTIQQMIQRSGWIVGSPDTVAKAIKDITAVTVPIGGFLIVTSEWASTENWNRSLELFARYVMPQFTGQLKGTTNAWKRATQMSETGALGRPNY